jgi:hypothetical protein
MEACIEKTWDMVFKFGRVFLLTVINEQNISLEHDASLGIEIIGSVLLS